MQDSPNAHVVHLWLNSISAIKTLRARRCGPDPWLAKQEAASFASLLACHGLVSSSPVDDPDENFVITRPLRSTIFGNPLLGAAANNPRSDVAGLVSGRTLHEYWMEDSRGRYGVDLAAF
ncbi:hypothetical protein E4U53_003343, partial [Claviceps sorghi]